MTSTPTSLRLPADIADALAEVAIELRITRTALVCAILRYHRPWAAVRRNLAKIAPND